QGHRCARVSDLVELEIRHHAEPAPQPRVEEDRRDARQHERPPDPVSGNAVPADDVGDQVRGVAAERGGDHREAREPPWHGAAAGKDLRRVLAGATAEEECRSEAQQHAEDGDEPVDEGEMHGRRALYLQRGGSWGRRGRRVLGVGFGDPPNPKPHLSPPSNLRPTLYVLYCVTYSV